ncbi:MAG: branched-chain amino acid ABC transporter permease [Deltaproteobacteria bacterium]|nr:branched-chain amino acid ABC transporter permease [Deltaproteobacteria bacterium]
MTDRKKYIAPLFLLFFLLFPLFVRDRYIIHIVILCFIWGAVAESWNLIMGYAGIFSLGQIGFFVIGGYTSAMLSKALGLSPWLGMPSGGLLAVAAGLIIGLPCLRLKGVYIALLTLAFADSIPYLIILTEGIGSGGSSGLPGIPSLSLGGFDYGFEKIPYYYTALVLSGICLLVIYKVIRSNIGLGFMGLRDSEDFAKSLGINEYKYKLLVFGISAFLTGIMGAFYGHYVSSLGPKLLGLDLFLTVIMMVEFGGTGRFPGALLGAFIITLLNEFLRAFGLYRLVILGVVVVSSIIFMPEGVIGYVDYIGRIRVLAGAGRARQKGDTDKL